MPRSLALVVVMPFLIATLRANPHLDDDGFIRTWIVFAPVPLVAGTSAADAIDQPHLRNEAELAPRSGDQVPIGGKQRKWKSGTFKNFIVDFNAFIGAQTHNAVGYAVTYIYCDDEVSDLALSIGFNDFGKAYLNGREALKQTEGGALQKDRVTVPVTLKKGRNILILKTINEANNFEACARLVQTDGTPLRDITITTDP